jgi:HK97 family phage portal protein
MGFLDLIVREALAAKAEATKSEMTPYANSLWLGSADATWTGTSYTQLADEGYIANAIGFRCIEERATAIGSIPWEVKTKDAEAEELASHPLSIMLHRPNPWASQARFFYTLMHHLDIGGAFFIQMLRDSTGQPVELHLRRPDKMNVVVDDQGPKWYEYKTKDYKTIQIDARPADGKCEILHFWFFNPNDEWNGLSPLRVALKDFNIHNAFAQWNNTVLKNDWRPGLVIETDNYLGPEQRNEVERMAKEEMVGFENAASPLVLRKGMHVKQTGWSPKDIDWTEGRRQAARDICHPFMMSPMMLALPGDNTYSSLREARAGFWEGPIRWLYSALYDELNNWLPRFYKDGADICIEPDLDDTPALAERENQAWERQAKAKDVLDIDERRGMLDYGPRKDDSGTVILTGANQVPLSDYAPGAPPREAPAKALDQIHAEYVDAVHAAGMTVADANTLLGG